MALTLEDVADLRALDVDQIIDVRAPSEFAEDHVPGAINLPVLSDEERARVGALYVQSDRFLARKVGAALVARNAAVHLEGPLFDRPGGWRPLIYCWRGGQRSGSFATILSQVGWRVELLKGGYKSYRACVTQMLYNRDLPYRFQVIDGGTGMAKTRLLDVLREEGAQVLDLERLAGHRGSLFGGIGPQPSQKMFESQLAHTLSSHDPTRTVFIEAESSRIGRITLPPSLWSAMQAAPRVRLTAPLSARVDHILETYPDLRGDRALQEDVLMKLVRFHGHERVNHWRELARSGAQAQLVKELIAEHYDPRYRRSARPSQVDEIALPDLGRDTLARLARELSS